MPRNGVRLREKCDGADRERRREARHCANANDPRPAERNRLGQRSLTGSVETFMERTVRGDNVLLVISSVRMSGYLSTALCCRFPESHQCNLPASSVFVIRCVPSQNGTALESPQPQMDLVSPPTVTA